MWFFLTAYDPTDLPGSSIDPLGFERGYLFLADKILPGMTNVASCPRYFALICSAVLIAAVSDDLPPREQRERRQEAILRLERLWALANVLFTDESKALSGLRGVTYAQRQAQWLAEHGHQQALADFKLLSRQMPYGAIGIYGAVAEYLKLLYRKTFELTPGLGERLAEAFIHSTEMPNAIKRSVREGENISLSTLRSWGAKAYLWANPSLEESECFYEMLHCDSIRSRFAELLELVPFADDDDNELKRLERIVAIANKRGEVSLAEAAQGILHFEDCYRHAMVCLERLLFLCHTHGGAVSPDVLNSDHVLKHMRQALPSSVYSFNTHLSSVTTEHFLKDTENRLRDVRLFLNRVRDATDSNKDLAEVIVARHTDVQHGKFDRGQRKMPWLQWQNGVLTLTMTRASESRNEIIEPQQILAHPYRLNAADALIQSAKNNGNK